MSLAACGSEGGSDEPSTEAGPGAAEDATADAGDAPPDTEPDAGPDAQEDAAPDASEASSDADEDIATVTILHTSEERGRLLPEKDGTKVRGGAANVAGWWKDVEKADPSTHLVVSTGGSWTGSPSSTWLAGENVVEVMGLMGYRATTLSARDYDFGREALLSRISEASYSFVSANTLDKETGALADFVDPYVIVPIDGVQVAVIGLMKTGHDVNPAEVADLVFAEPVATVEAYAQEARAQGADVVVVLSSELLQGALVSLQSSPVDVVFTGRQQAHATTVVGDVAFVDSGSYWHGYHRVELRVNRTTGAVVDRTVEWVAVEYEEAEGNPVVPSPEVQAAVESWEQVAQADLGEEIGYTETGVAKQSWEMANWVTDAWLAEFPDADMAIQNVGGMQAALPPGPITVGDLVAMLPFENYIYQVDMTGAQVQDSVAAMLGQCGGCILAVGGIRYAGTPVVVTLSDGTALEPQSAYQVLLNSYVWAGGAGFPHDPALEPVVTGRHMRDPVIAWTKQLATSASDPLEAHLDSAPRNQ